MRAPLITFLFLSVLGIVALGLAQEEEEVVDTSAWIDEYTEGTESLAFAAREIKKENYQDALEVYQKLIDNVRKVKGFGSKVILFHESVYLPVRRFCYEQILGLPPQGMEIYNILYDAKAQRSYDVALAAHNIQGLVAVAQDYALTEAGKEACMALADIYIEEADYPAALYYLDTLLYYHYHSTQEPAICALKRAACLLQSGNADLARHVMRSLEEKQLEGNESRVCKCLAEMANYASGDQTTKQEIYNSYYDGFVNIGNTPSPKLVEEPAEGARDPLTWRFLLERKDSNSGSDGRRSYRPNRSQAEGTRGFDLYPVFYKDTVFLNDSSRIYALAIKGGKIKWREPDREAPHIDGLPLGCFVSDGKLFAILKNANTYNIRYTRKMQAVQALIELYCFNAEKSGKNPPLWHTAEMRNTTDLGETSFTSIPFVQGSRVYVAGSELTEQAQNYSVCCFSTEGELLWKTTFCATKWTHDYSRSLLRAASLTVTRGKVIACTNVGVTAAINAFTGELEWVYKYPQVSIVDKPPRGISLTWQPLPPITWYGVHPADNKLCETLVLVPGDSDFILGFDMAALRLLWRYDRCGHTYIIGPRGEDIFVYGGNSFDPAATAEFVVRQHRIPDGLIRWEAQLDSEPVGKGLATPQALYVPCRDHLVEIVSGKNETMFFGKVSTVARWRIFGEDDQLAEKSLSPSSSQSYTQPVGGDKTKEEAAKKRDFMLRGNLLFLPERIITAGYKWVNCFKSRKKPAAPERQDKPEPNGD